MEISNAKELQARFNQPLPEDYRRRIIFWQDPDREFENQIDELQLENVKILKLTGKNNFAVKQLLSEIDLDSNYLIYNPISYSDVRDNWLLDIELYSEEYRADRLSQLIQTLNASPTPQMRKAMKGYSKFCENKERLAKLNALHMNLASPGQLHIGVLSVLSVAKNNTPAGIIRALLMAGLDPENNEVISDIRKFGNEAILWEMVQRYTGYTHAEGNSLLPLASHILLTSLSVTMSGGCLKGLEALISEQHKEACYALVNEWMHSDDDDSLYEIAREVETVHHLTYRFDHLEVDDLMNSECFPCINECILRRYMTEVTENVIKTSDIISAVDKRRTTKWYKRVQYYYEGLLQVANMQQFYQANISGFHIAEHEKLWKAYCSDYCRMDYYYRMFHTAFGRSLKESSTVLEDLYKNVADYVEKLYKNWYLKELGSQWSKLIEDELGSGYALSGITHQEDFFTSFVRPIFSYGSRAYVIISDALRYEVAVELTGLLTRETKGVAKIASIQSVFPSVTRYGMAALLPHKKLNITADGKVLCDDLSTEGTANREKVLQRVHAGNVAVTYKQLLTMKQAERREMVSKANIVYIYHNTIDAVGDKAATEDQVFDACADAIGEIKNLIRIIVNDLNGSNILITADHGFLYSYKPLEESDKLEKSFASEKTLELDRRYVIASPDCADEHMIRVPMKHFDSDLMGFAPKEYIRVKKQGGGMNYVHGGVSLQEMVVPVIEYRNLKASSKGYVEIKKAPLELLSQSRKVSNSIFALDFYQKEAVSGKTVAATYEVCMTDAAGTPVSDKKTIIADRKQADEKERIFRTRFTLKSVSFSKTETYYLVIVDKDAKKQVDRIEFTIDIAFINDFDF